MNRPAFETAADRRVRAAVTALVLDQPFFGVLAVQLNLLADATCATAWTDGKTLGYNPAFVDTLSDVELQGLIAHEVMHCACLHPWRRAGRDAKRWNIACDYAINAVIRDSGFTLPAGALLSAEYTGHCAEWVYDRLPADGPEQDQDGEQAGGGDQDGDAGQDGQPGDSGQPGEVRDAPAGDDAPTADEWAQTVEQATRVCQAQGTLPGGVSGGALTAAKAPTVDWRAALRKYVQETCTADYSWTRPNTRYLSSGLYLPALKAERCGRIVVGVDTSGSVDDVLLAQFGAELQAIVDDVQPAGVTVIYCDTEVNHVDEYEPGDAIVLARHGGGGTAFAPVFDHVEATGDAAPAVLVYLTDLYGTVPAVGPEYPVIWAVTGDMGTEQTPWGDVVPVE